MSVEVLSLMVKASYVDASYIGILHHNIELSASTTELHRHGTEDISISSRVSE